jgi:hypothetical protein
MWKCPLCELEVDKAPELEPSMFHTCRTKPIEPEARHSAPAIIFKGSGWTRKK